MPATIRHPTTKGPLVLKLEVTYRGLLFAGLALLSLWALFRLWPLLLLLIAAFIFMTALLPFVEWMTSKGIHRVVAVLLILLLILATLAGLLSLVVPAMIDEFRNVRDELPENAVRVEDLLAKFGINVELEERARNIDWNRVISGRDAMQYGQQALGIGLAMLTVTVLSAYLLIEAPRLAQFIYQFVPPGHEPQVERVLQSLRRVVGGYVRGQFITSVAIGLYTFGVMFALGVPDAIAFGVIAAFADIIPLVGATIATVPPVLVSLQQSSTKAVILLGLLLLYQQFEDRYFSPKVYGATLNLPPLIVLLTILASAELLGLAGVLLALPGAAVGRVALDYWLERRTGNPAANGPRGDAVAPDVTGKAS